ncbi:MAG: GNAT family N-acetyltransferase [Gemmataceae bacterium]|nr:GNAT family N-acetyltransferase [Gemmataceae bacterium]
MPGTTYFLEMFAAPVRTIPPPREGLSTVHAVRPTVAYYRFLYETVGRDYGWTSRKKMSDSDLKSILQDPLNEVHVLMVNGSPGGFVELDRRKEWEIEITQFGLMGEHIGQGLGKYFLHWALHRAWSCQPKRVWLHTCTNDHAHALVNYRKAGLQIYQETPRA